VTQLPPQPPPEGRKKYYTRPVMSDGMNEIRHPISMSALMVTRFMRTLKVSLKRSGIIKPLGWQE
jgi:hypothetical protein